MRANVRRSQPFAIIEPERTARLDRTGSIGCTHAITGLWKPGVPATAEDASELGFFQRGKMVSWGPVISAGQEHRPYGQWANLADASPRGWIGLGALEQE
jgi:hypothetical protein